MNYVKSGGGMDIATRKFSEIAAKYADATFVVSSKTGSGGLIAANYVLGQPADKLHRVRHHRFLCRFHPCLRGRR